MLLRASTKTGTMSRLYSTAFLIKLLFHCRSVITPLIFREHNPAGKVIIGTVKGDIHDIGKNIVVMFLKGSGFELIDLGVDVPAEVFVKTVKKEGAKVVGLSVLLNSMFTAMKDVVDKLAEAGLRDRVKVIIGGSPCNEDVRRFTGADYYAKDASEGARICKEIYS